MSIRRSVIWWSVCSIVAGWCHVGAADVRYTIRPLPYIDGQFDVYAQGVNDHQQVVGYTIDGRGAKQAVLWEDRVATPLPGLEGGTESWAFRLNERGQIAGKARTSDGHLHAVIWEGGQIRDLGVLPGGGNSFAADINERGVVVGSSEGSVGSYAFRWTPETGMEPVGVSDPPLRLAVAGFNGINDDGLAVGTHYVLLEPFQAAFARPGEKLVTSLSPPGRTLGMALAVNNRGTIVGYQSEPNASPQAAIFHTDGTYEQLGTLGLEESWAQDVNDQGTIVGRAFSFGPGGDLIPRAFVYEQGRMEDLLRMVDDGTGWHELIEATSISNSGVIVGEGIFEGEVRGFIAIPVPEPACALLLTVGMVLLLSHRARTSTRERSSCV